MTLSATAEPSTDVKFRWDFTSDGRFDMRARANPTVVHTYPDETNVTARVGARNLSGEMAQDTVGFATLRCTA